MQLDLFSRRLQTWSRRQKSNFSLMELSGSLGDLGTLLPILIALSITGQISLSSSLVFGGLWNILTGLSFGIPMCVQPMKAIAATALTSKLSIEEVMSAGMFVSACVFALGITRTLRLVSRITPLPVIKGIQFGAGIQLVLKAAKLIVENSSWGGSKWDWTNNFELALLSGIFVFAFFNHGKVPTALILFLVGIILAIIRMVRGVVPGPSFEFYHPVPVIPTPEQFAKGVLSAGLGQLPLTLLNSVVALAALADELFPENAPFSIDHLSMSVGAMNLIGCWFGSMPYCHGSGGLAGQYRFGARSELSILLLGLVKLALGLFLGNSLVTTFSNIPSTILGVMLFVCGIELARAGRKYTNPRHSDEKQSQDFTILVVTTGLLVGFSSDAIGFLGGLIVAYTFKAMEWLYSRESLSESPTSSTLPVVQDSDFLVPPRS
ncbi:hypothetical protein DSO57_1037042 [Entomophthora muscae]|uniref:Uncharacterized protein n=1 Tax=Entomophthora muscae TaxID=34485 RepID=A0ACC2SZ46_9FUNG|nr:hypothetical protein DSO57_1037042 [Entomophthora muscae]